MSEDPPLSGPGPADRIIGLGPAFGEPVGWEPVDRLDLLALIDFFANLLFPRLRTVLGDRWPANVVTVDIDLVDGPLLTLACDEFARWPRFSEALAAMCKVLSRGPWDDDTRLTVTNIVLFELLERERWHNRTGVFAPMVGRFLDRAFFDQPTTDLARWFEQDCAPSTLPDYVELSVTPEARARQLAVFDGLQGAAIDYALLLGAPPHAAADMVGTSLAEVWSAIVVVNKGQADDFVVGVYTDLRRRRRADVRPSADQLRREYLVLRNKAHLSVELIGRILRLEMAALRSLEEGSTDDQVE